MRSNGRVPLVRISLVKIEQVNVRHSGVCGKEQSLTCEWFSRLRCDERSR
jgi:hypothetical protein